MVLLPLENPQPDFETFRKVIMGEEKPDRVHFVEYMVDFDIINEVIGKFMTDMNQIPDLERAIFGDSDVQIGPETLREAIEGSIKFYHRMGYDYYPNVISSPGIPLFAFMSILGKKRIAEDTAQLAAKGAKRMWVEENIGVVSNWEEFEDLKSKISRVPLKPIFDFISEKVPEGMKVIPSSGSVWEMTMERVMGYVNLFRKLYEDPELVKAVIDWVGEILYNDYKEVVTYDCVGGLFHADDMGYKKGTIVKPDVYRELVFPWHKKYAKLAHQHGKMYWCHSCGNVLAIMEDLIEDVKIDAFHSFQDAIMPIWEFQEKYGDRIAVLGGVDMDKLARYDQSSLQKYVNEILDRCMPRGRYALGAGNSVANYVPVENYLTMLETGLKWRP